MDDDLFYLFGGFVIVDFGFLMFVYFLCMVLILMWDGKLCFVIMKYYFGVGVFFEWDGMVWVWNFRLYYVWIVGV